MAEIPEPPVWTDVCALDDIPRLGARVVRRARGGDIAIFRTASDAVHALLDRCPHKGGPLSQGLVFEDRVACPLHDWQIRLADGEALEPDHGCARRFHVRVVDGRVQLDAAQLRTTDDDAARIAA
jgi:nitrite reductase (NADH) small subunit